MFFTSYDQTGILKSNDICRSVRKQEVVLFLNEGQVNRDGKSLNKSDMLKDIGYLFAISDDILSNYGVIWSVN